MRMDELSERFAEGRSEVEAADGASHAVNLQTTFANIPIAARGADHGSQDGAFRRSLREQIFSQDWADTFRSTSWRSPPSG